ncbi:MAG: hypothetical protein ACM3QS_06240, partial [Bacteroidota bacterium]
AMSLLRRKYSPLLLIALAAVLAYGLVLAQTGFYWDDLPMSWIRYELGPRAMSGYFSTNRPVWGWLYQVTTRLLPQVPVYWQAFALFWRWLCALLVWFIGRELCPGRARFALGLALLFLVYPGFNGQWTAYLYSHFFIVLGFFLASLLCTLLDLRLRNRLWLAAGLLFSALNLWMMEYFFVLELTRGAVIWVAVSPDGSNLRGRVVRTLRAWWPYLGLFAAAVLSRLFVFNNQVYGFGLLPALRADFANTALGLFKNALTSFWTVSLGAWGQAFQPPDPRVHGPRTMLIYAAVVLLVAGMLLVWGWQRRESAVESDRVSRAWWMIGLGVVMLPFASAPFWLIDLPVTLAFPANRFTLPSMLGVSLMLAGALQLIARERLRLVLLAILVGMAAGRQFLWGTDFSRDWQVQKNLFWQMTWRAPGLEPNTLVLLNEGALKFYADNSLSAALNWIYAPDLKATGVIPYLLFYPTNRLEGGLPALDFGVNVNYDYLAGRFTGSTARVVSFYFKPPSCLRLLDPVIDYDNRLIPDQYLMRQAAGLSSPEWIMPEQSAKMPAVYAPEPAHGWCYYFERADLARQVHDWRQAADLGEKAFALDDYPNDPSERFVFIEAYAHTGDWTKAVNYSVQSHRVSPGYVDPLLCRLWMRIQAQTPESSEKAAALEEIKTKFGCEP